MYSKWDKWLFRQVDNSALVLFRMFFGFLLACEAFGHIALGAVDKHFLQPKFTFTFIGFEFLEPLPAPLMYGLFVMMGIAGLLVMVGFKYRTAMIFYAITWTYVYLLQKTSYNNHYYLLMLLNYIMIFLPAHRSVSIDAKWNPRLRKEHMSRWIYLFIIAFLFIVYSYASVAKFYPDWIDTSFPKHLMKIRAGDWNILQQEWAHWAIMIYGLSFDILIVPLLLWKRTRMIAVIASFFFHIFNSIIFKIGIFPYLALAFLVFFFKPKTIQKRFLKKKQFYDGDEIIVPSYKKPTIAVTTGFLVIMILLPLRHWVINDDVLWTEEGHRLSWRMMLRNRRGFTTYYVENKKTGSRKAINYNDYLTTKQSYSVQTKPDFMWQFAQKLKEFHAMEGEDVAVFIDAKVSINGRPLQQFTDKEIDVAAQEWSHWSHHEWILPSSLYENKE
ncbi:HTTM domain-containing protein [Nonlabens ulvanivorans]|uniref:HTTM domain-containing protein n=1 Tax=Nonlabens ulvanivorans TaxID=906888 RepID=A0A084JT64_NONUL|nr:HTTM domain-containing protein [Nonlabens ulvanivorans]KEZ92148.1 HTTM domain-containing protein [Nonlabens ulvanivorans]PRX14977.1 vitamin K-dependent gamma-carboxylase-like protein [Nonlabens ulvanivorans]